MLIIMYSYTKYTERKTKQELSVRWKSAVSQSFAVGGVFIVTIFVYQVYIRELGLLADLQSM
jgi:hypothetical protein